jgi:putative tricarboxylic transport membrane protein
MRVFVDCGFGFDNKIFSFMISDLLSGLMQLGSVANAFWIVSGVIVGMIVGILPGLGPVAALSMLLPLSFSAADAVQSIVFMSGLYIGTQYGGAVTSILLRLPGEAASMVTTLDGYAMTKKGRAGAAITIAALASFVGGTAATVIIMLAVKPLAEFALKIGPADMTAVMLLGMVCAVSLIRGSWLVNSATMLTGVLLGLVGTDVISGTPRFTFDVVYLRDGLNFAIVAIGVFGLGEVLWSMLHDRSHQLRAPSMSDLFPSRDETKQAAWPTLRGTAVGSIMGLIPGCGSLISSFVSYALERRISSNPDSFGCGNPAGVAAPEAANNAGAQTSFVPMLSLGLPVTPIMALMIAALMIHGIEPGPELVEKHPDLFWALVASMWVSNLVLIILNIPLLPIWLWFLRIPRQLLNGLIVLICVWAVWQINTAWQDLILLATFAVIGYWLRLMCCEPAPMAMGFVIGSLFEENLRRALLIANGDWSTFVTNPISLFCLAATLILVIWSLIREKHTHD